MNETSPKFWALQDGTIVFQRASYEQRDDKRPLLLHTNATIELNIMHKKIELILQHIRDTHIAEVDSHGHGRFSANTLSPEGECLGIYQQSALMPDEEPIIGQPPVIRIPYEMTMTHVVFDGNKRELSIPIKPGDDIRIDEDCNVYINGKIS